VDPVPLLINPESDFERTSSGSTETEARLEQQQQVSLEHFVFLTDYSRKDDEDQRSKGGRLRQRIRINYHE
jgi:hypothetical protein